MADDRRVIFSSYVVPQESASLEETSVGEKWSILRSINKTLGGKGICTDINKDQWGEGWTSFVHRLSYWEDWGDIWQTVGETWTGELSVTDTGVALASGIANDLSFLYIKNIGKSAELQVSTDGALGVFYILIPPDGSISLRGPATGVTCNEVFVKTASGTTTIEYIIAKQ